MICLTVQIHHQGDFFEEWNEITLQIHIRKFKELEYRVPKLLSSETDYQRNFQSVDTLPGLKKVRCSLQLLSLNLFLF